jgi:mannose-6-phosphate isomerase
MTLYPLKFNPVFCDRIWGGNKLKTVLFKDLEPRCSKLLQLGLSAELI